MFLNNSRNNSIKLIEFDENYEFGFLEDSETKLLYPVSDYYYILNDLSINLLINLKWIKWGYTFFILLKNNLNLIKDDISMKEITPNSLQQINNIINADKIIFLDGVEIKSDKDFNETVKILYFNSNFTNIFTENTNIHLKMKLNLNEYLILNNTHFPALIKYREITF